MQHYCGKLGAVVLGVAILELGLILWKIHEDERLLAVRNSRESANPNQTSGFHEENDFYW